MTADFFDVVLSQRAHRRFTDAPVDDALVEQCLVAATHAPSAENKQPWEFVVVSDAARRAALGDLTRAAWHGGGRAFSEHRLPSALLAEVDEGAEGSVAAAPVLVVVCGNAEDALEVTLPASVFPAVQNLLLAATALGLGSALTTLALQRAAEVRSLLGLPGYVHPMAIVPLGWPPAPVGPPRRRPPRIHHDRYEET